MSAPIGSTGFILVPREPNARMQERLTDLGKALIADPHERDQYCWFAIKAWRAMLAIEDGE